MKLSFERILKESLPSYWNKSINFHKKLSAALEDFIDLTKAAIKNGQIFLPSNSKEEIQMAISLLKDKYGEEIVKELIPYIKRMHYGKI